MTAVSSEGGDPLPVLLASLGRTGAIKRDAACSLYGGEGIKITRAGLNWMGRISEEVKMQKRIMALPLRLPNRDR
jgi:hypothetical protein